MSYRIYNGTQLLGDVTNKSTGINGLLPATSYQLGVTNYNGSHESPKTTINVKTRGIRLIIPVSLTVNSTITLNYQEYSLGLVPIGTEPAGMFGGGNKRNIQAKVISVDNGRSTVELLEPLESSSTVSIGGGKNLARRTSDSWVGVGTQEFNGGTNFTKFVAYVYLDDLNVGDKVTVQIMYQYSGVTATNSQCWLQGEGNVTSWNSGVFYGGSNSVINMQTGTDVKSGSKKYTFDITADMKKNRFWRVYYRFDNVNKGAWFQWSKFKVERGSVATPWSPALEDTQYIVDDTQMTKLQDGSFAAFNGYKAIYFNQ